MRPAKMKNERGPPGSVEDGKDSTEETNLLLPSPNSTENPSSSNLPNGKPKEPVGYGSEDTEPLLESANMPPPTPSMQNLLNISKVRDNALKYRPWTNRLIWSVVLVLVALLFIHFSMARHHAANVEPAHRHHDENPPSTPSNPVIPFSVLDPVVDMGLYHYKRNSDTSPPDMFKQTLKTYPTNAWYQNMLLARGEPNIANRAYAVPYLLDMVGSIPGLRVHPNRVTANVNLVQLTFVDSHALTMGVDRDLKSTMKYDFTQSYKILNTKALAVTLEWVSQDVSM